MLKLVLALKKELILIKELIYFGDEKKFNSEDILIYFEEIL